MIQALQAETRLPVLPVKPLGDKGSRAAAVSPLVESGRVYLPAAAAWLSDFMDEVSSFPAAPHDDQVDALTQALNHLRGSYHKIEWTPIPMRRELSWGGGDSRGRELSPTQREARPGMRQLGDLLKSRRFPRGVY